MDEGRILYLSRNDVESLGLGLPDIVSLLEFAFREKAAGRTAMPPKHWIERSPDTFYSAMTSYIPALGTAGCKWQSGDPRNPSRGLPYILGLFILCDDETGLPTAIMDSTWITAMRTAAASAVTARHLALKTAQAVGILGCGVQGRTNLEALKLMIPTIKTCAAYDVKTDVAERYSVEMSEKLGMDVRAVATAPEAVMDCDIIVTSGPIQRDSHPVIEPGWVRPGALGVALDYDAYWTPSAVESMDYVVTDDLNQIVHLKEHGYFRKVNRVDAELGDILVGGKPSRTTRDERILAFNLGIAIEDLATATEIWRRALDRGFGTWLPL